MALQTLDLWSLVRGRPQIDPHDLADAVAAQAAADLDYRTRLLIRDSVEALRGYWGQSARVERLAGGCPAAARRSEIDLPRGVRQGRVSLIEEASHGQNHAGD